MSDEKLEQPKEQQTSTEETGARVVPASDDKVTLNLSDLKDFMKSTVEEVLKNSKQEETRRQVEEYNAKMAESVSNTHATLIKSNIAHGQTHTDYIKRVIDEDHRRRKQDSEGKARYSDKGEDFIKAKIVVLKKIGLTEEEIAKELKDVL